MPLASPHCVCLTRCGGAADERAREERRARTGGETRQLGFSLTHFCFSRRMKKITRFPGKDFSLISLGFSGILHKMSCLLTSKKKKQKMHLGYWKTMTSSNYLRMWPEMSKNEHIYKLNCKVLFAVYMTSFFYFHCFYDFLGDEIHTVWSVFEKKKISSCNCFKRENKMNRHANGRRYVNSPKLIASLFFKFSLVECWFKKKKKKGHSHYKCKRCVLYVYNKIGEKIHFLKMSKSHFNF